MNPAALSIFDDSGELDHAMYLVRTYAKQAEHTLSPDYLARARDASGLPFLENKLRDVLEAIPDLSDPGYLSILHSELQDACAEALALVRSAPDPGDWNSKNLDELNQRLLRVQAIRGDIAHFANESTNLDRRTGGESHTDTATLLLRDMASAYQQKYGRTPTARKLVNVMREAGFIEDADPNTLRLKDEDGRTASIANDMKIIGDRLRNFRDSKKTSRS